MTKNNDILDKIKIQYPNVGMLNDRLLLTAPRHESYLAKRFTNLADFESSYLSDIAQDILALVGNQIDEFVSDYDWLCEQLVEDDLHFRRHGSYRLSTNQQAYDEIYSNTDFMRRYMNGLLLTQLWWSNHTDQFGFYIEQFLAKMPDQITHLEVGPGHGLLLYYACKILNAKEITAWDISQGSIDSCEHALKALGVSNMPNLKLRDLMAAETHESFDSIVLSEVLEHMDEPDVVLKKLHSILSDSGRLFLNVPVNSPAPDHLFNAGSPEALAEFISDQGFEIERKHLSPQTNYTLDRARKMKLTISCGYICKKA